MSSVKIEPITGRYMQLDIHGRPHRLYWEEAGSGIPLVCLHTAGADGRQYRALLNDPKITERFRVIVFFQYNSPTLHSGIPHLTAGK